jgi:hypothetical protein
MPRNTDLGFYGAKVNTGDSDSPDLGSIPIMPIIIVDAASLKEERSSM